MKLTLHILFILLIVLVLSCKHTTEYFEIDDSPEEIDFSNFHIEFFDSDSFHIISNEDFFLDKMSVNEIVIYEQPIDTSVFYSRYRPTFTKVDSIYRMHFDIPIVASSPVVKYDIYFILLNNEYVHVDTTISYITYPSIDGARIEFALKDIPDWRPTDDNYHQYHLPEGYWNIDAFDISDDGSYWTFITTYGDKFGWDRNNNGMVYYTFNVLPSLPKVVKSNFLNSQWQDIGYYNEALYWTQGFDVRKVDYINEIYVYFFGYGIHGNIIDDYADYYPCRLAVNSQYVHIFIEASGSPTTDWIITFDHDGNILKKTKWVEQGYYKGCIEEYNGIIYGYVRDTHELIRHNLNTETFLPRVPMPSNYGCCGFRIFNGRFYYVDWNYWVMMSLPLSSLINE